MKYLFSFYKILNALSIDVAAGTMICACFFASYCNVVIFSQGVALLGLVVWIIYTVDHLVDAKKLTHSASMFRHQFHQKHFIVISIFVAMAALAACFLLFFIRHKLFLSGLGVGVLAIIYILFNRWFIYSKELAGALLYCLGVFLPTFTFQQKYFFVLDWMVLVQFFLIALTNLILFSWMDHEEDERDCYASLATQIGKNGVTMVLRFLFLITFILLGYIFSQRSTLGFIYLLMVTGLFIIFLFPDYFKKESRYRLLGDAIFFLPILLLI